MPCQRYFFECPSKRVDAGVQMDTLNLIILSQDKTSAARAFYLKMAIRKRWSKRKLERPFRGALFERVVLSPPKMSALPTQILQCEAAEERDQ